ncbi:VOC family protein, partial [Aspergillus novofumigatus IBT 16806]
MARFAVLQLLLCLSAGLTEPDTHFRPSSLSESLRFYVDGLGLNIIRNYTFQGDLTTLFGTSTSVLPGYFLGDTTSVHNGTDGVIYLVEFPDAKKIPTVDSDPPNTGLFLTSFWMGDKINATLERLDRLGMGGKPHVATFSFGSEPLATYATVRDPDGARVLLVSRPYINSIGKQLP